MSLRSRVSTRLGHAWSAALLGVLLAIANPTVALAYGTSQPAVSGPNGKLSMEGGEYDDAESFLALGSYSIPLGHAFGAQADGAVGSIDEEVVAGGGLHLFARNPSSFLLGVYSSYHEWDSIEVWRAAGEFEVYVARFSLSGLAGYEDVDVPGSERGLPLLTDDDEHIFGQAELSYYPLDNLKLSGGYLYVNEASLGSAGVEYLIEGAGIPVALFAKGNFGDSDYDRVTGGLKVYFGADSSKSLIERDRQDDPPNHTPVFPSIPPPVEQNVPPPAGGGEG